MQSLESGVEDCSLDTLWEPFTPLQYDYSEK